MMNCPQRGAQNPEPETWNLEPGTWNSELGTFNTQSGFLLVTAIFLLVILAALGAFILTISGTQQTSSALDVQGSRAYQAARAGIEWASFQLLTPCAGYSYGRTITIAHTNVPNTDQSNFPVLFSGTYAGGGGSLDLRTVANGGKVTNASGYDIIFQGLDGSKLDHQIESYNAATGAVNFWVRVPTVSHTTDTAIYLCYGSTAITTSQENITGVWASNFRGVWHLKESGNGTAGEFKDSTTNANNGQGGSGSSTNTPVQVTGEIWKGQGFNGTSQWIQVPNSPSFTYTPSFTASAWIYPTAWGSSANQYIKDIFDNENTLTGANTGTFTFRLGSQGLSTLQQRLGMNIQTGTTPPYTNHDMQSNSNLSLNAWQYVAVTYDGSNVRFYINGSLDSTTAFSLTPGNPSNNWFIGTDATSGGQRFFQGNIDELRVANTALSSDFITTEYNNQSNPSAFYTLGAENVLSTFATNCTTSPPYTATLTGMGGTLSGFTTTVFCSSSTTTEGGATRTVYQITSTGAQGTAGTLSGVERQLQVTLIK